MHRITRAAGEIIYSQGENAQSAFLLLDGRVTMTRGGVVTQSGKGAVIGFSGLFDRPYGSTAVADTDCALLVFSRKELKALIRSNPVEADSIIQGIITVLGDVSASLEAYASRLSPPAEPPVQVPLEQSAIGSAVERSPEGGGKSPLSNNS